MKVEQIKKLVKDSAWAMNLGDWIVTPSCCVRLFELEGELQIEDKLPEYANLSEETIRKSIESWLSKSARERMQRLNLVWKPEQKLQVELFRTGRGFVGLNTKFTRIFDPDSEFLCDPENPGLEPVIVRCYGIVEMGIIMPVRMKGYQDLLPELRFA